MSDRTDTVPMGTITALPLLVAQPDEFLRRARIATAEAAVNATSRRLADTYLPSAERWSLAREHEVSLKRLAVLRAEAGTATLNDHRLINPEAAQAAEDRFWASGGTWAAADVQLVADVAAMNSGGVHL